MLISNSNFIKIINTLLESEFTFLIHKLIFKYLLILEEMFLDDGYADSSKIGISIEVIADLLQNKEKDGNRLLRRW